MDPKTKRALLYSLLVCPGTGHWLLGRRGRGAALVAAAVVLVGWFGFRLVVMMIGFYNELMESLYGGESLPDVGRLGSMHASIYVDNWWLLVAIGVIWVYGVWDIYPRKGRG